MEGKGACTGTRESRARKKRLFRETQHFVVEYPSTHLSKLTGSVSSCVLEEKDKVICGIFQLPLRAQERA